jgi:hypothetical protein
MEITLTTDPKKKRKTLNRPMAICFHPAISGGFLIPLPKGFSGFYIMAIHEIQPVTYIISKEQLL